MKTSGIIKSNGIHKAGMAKGNADNEMKTEVSLNECEAEGSGSGMKLNAEWSFISFQFS